MLWNRENDDKRKMVVMTWQCSRKFMMIVVILCVCVLKFSARVGVIVVVGVVWCEKCGYIECGRTWKR